MKTLKIAMIATLVAFAMVSLASTDGFKTQPIQKVIHLTFTQAMQRPDLVREMYKQLNDDFLNKYQFSYTVKVSYKGAVVFITGTYDQWRMFFRLKWRITPDEISPNNND